MNIQEDYVSFEVAKLLKEKGFDESCYLSYKYDEHFKKWLRTSELISTGFEEFYYFCPTLQMAMKWLRLHHHLHIIVEVTWKDKIPHYQWRIEVLNTQDTIVDTPCCNKAEQACEAAIKYCLENLI